MENAYICNRRQPYLKGTVQIMSFFNEVVDLECEYASFVLLFCNVRS